MGSPRQRRRKPPASDRDRFAFRAHYLLVIAVFALVGLAIWLGTREPPQVTSEAPPPSSEILIPGLVESQEEAYARYGGSMGCRECHEKEYDLWITSNHGLAERFPSREQDGGAFQPGRTFEHGTQSTDIVSTNDLFQVVCLGFDGKRETYTVERVIGNTPLIQYLVPGPRGRLQTLEASYDPKLKEWFNVYGEEDRQPGEWGHWTGRGMTWNTMCASCHNTRLRKNYDEVTDSYRTASVEMGVGCEACHGPMKEHGEWRRQYPDPNLPDPTLVTLNPRQVLYTCASCHARRLELTGDFVPGDLFHDHYALTIVDESDLYYADGQVMGENYVFASLLGSRMYAAGVRCLDCHDPHSIKNTRSGNDLCMRCHNGGYPSSPIIDPAAHGFHKLDDTGGQCVGCHMPHTVYMQRHPRRDHGFTIPDPLLTRELGIPNACNRCHTDKDVEWSIEYVDKWYGDRMERPTRRRARIVAAARAGQANARRDLIDLLANDEIAYWRAVAAGLLTRWADDPTVEEALRTALHDPDPLVRAQAASALDPLAQAGDTPTLDRLRDLLNDPMRVVRFRAAWSLRASLDPESEPGRELRHVLNINADQPGGQVQKGVYALARNDLQTALKHYRRAVDWDPYSPPLREELAVVLSMAGQSLEAVEQMQEACRLEPDEPEFRYRLALAYNEVGKLDRALEELDRTVTLDPTHSRAWYNLGLARNSVGQTDAALEALRRAESLSPTDPRIPYAQATILAQLRQIQRAREAAERALSLEPDFVAAQELLLHLQQR